VRHTLVLLTVLTLVIGSRTLAEEPPGASSTGVDSFTSHLIETVAVRHTAAPTADETLMGYFADLVRLGGGGYRSTERSAFLVRDTTGAIQCLLWPKFGGFQSETYHGPIPPGTVAIAHTHPKRLPYPSFGDRREATRLGIPFIVLSPGNINVATTSGDVIQVVTNRRWMRSLSEAAQGCEPLLEPAGSGR